MKRLCVFCGSSVGFRPVYSEQAKLFGGLIAARPLELVYGGGHVGLMGVLADAVLAGGGKVVGVIPRALVDKELAHRGLTELHVTGTMHERKQIMADLSDGFAALPGGPGTCDELFEIVTWAQLGIHRHPIGLLNTEGYFDPLLSWVERAFDEGFVKEKHRSLLMVESEPEKLLARMTEYVPGAPVEKWVRPGER